MDEIAKKNKFDFKTLVIFMLLIIIVAAVAYYIGFNMGLDKAARLGIK